MKTRIIVDSTADLVPEIKARVSTVPLTVHFGQEEYIDGVTIDNKTFYEKLIESDVLPTTSQATPDAFIKEFEKARQAGESAVVITLASKFSGTYQSAMIAAADYENIYVVDGTSAAMGTGILVELAFRLLDAGMTAEETAQALEEEKKKIVVVALVDTLEYLKRGGRISKTFGCIPMAEVFRVSIRLLIACVPSITAFRIPTGVFPIKSILLFPTGKAICGCAPIPRDWRKSLSALPFSV